MAVLPCFMGERDADLHRVALSQPVRAVRVGFHSDMRDTPRIRALVDFVVQEFAQLQAQLNPLA